MASLRCYRLYDIESGRQGNLSFMDSDTANMINENGGRFLVMPIIVDEMQPAPEMRGFKGSKEVWHQTVHLRVPAHYLYQEEEMTEKIIRHCERAMQKALDEIRDCYGEVSLEKDCPISEEEETAPYGD